jgi:hypothetical protein
MTWSELQLSYSRLWHRLKSTTKNCYKMYVTQWPAQFIDSSKL